MKTVGLVALIVAASLMLVESAGATPPATPTIMEPAEEGQGVHAADVHMQAGGFSDANGDTHSCSDWEIWRVSSSAKVWDAPCRAGVLSVHIHLGDGTFVGPYAGRTELEHDIDYELRVRFRDSAAEDSAFATRGFRTYPPSLPGGSVAWAAVQPGFVVEEVAAGLQLPVNVAFVPNPGPEPGAPLLYVAELYGTIKVVTRAGVVSDYATGLLNFDPTGHFPGSGELGLTGIVVDPASGDLIASLLYDSAPPDGPFRPKVIRLHSNDGGLTAASQSTVLDMPNEQQGSSHQISNLSFGPDGKLYVHIGDGFDYSAAQQLDKFRGKIVRLNLDGTAPSDNPLYDAGNGINATDYIFAYGFRNPFGGAWRAANGAHYQVENGPEVDRLSRVTAGTNYGWGVTGTNADLLANALYNWSPSHAPVNIAFIQPQTFSGSGFPASMMDHAFVTESGPTWASGPQTLGKRIVEFEPQVGGELGGLPRSLVEYTGTGKGTAAALAAGPDGLYFTELYKDLDFSTPIDAGARLLRIRYAPTPPATPVAGASEPFDLQAAKRRCKRKFDRKKARRKCVRRARERALG